MKIKAEELIRKIQKGELKTGTKIICHIECLKTNFDYETWFMGNWFSTSKKGDGNDNNMIIRLCDRRYTYEIIEENKKIEKLELESGKIDDKEFLAKYITHNRYKINELIDEINNLKEKKDE